MPTRHSLTHRHIHNIQHTFLKFVDNAQHAKQLLNKAKKRKGNNYQILLYISIHTNVFVRGEHLDPQLRIT